MHCVIIHNFKHPQFTNIFSSFNGSSLNHFFINILTSKSFDSTVSSYSDFYMDYTCICPILYNSHSNNSLLWLHSSSMNYTLYKNCTSEHSLWISFLSFRRSSLNYVWAYTILSILYLVIYFPRLTFFSEPFYKYINFIIIS